MLYITKLTQWSSYSRAPRAELHTVCNGDGVVLTIAPLQRKLMYAGANLVQGKLYS